MTAGWQQARKLFTVAGTCAECEAAPARERHHWDGDQFNNAPTNVVFLCRRCHMRLDGRLEALPQLLSPRRIKQPPKPCSDCERLWKPLRRGRCPTCYSRFKRGGGLTPCPRVV